MTDILSEDLIFQFETNNLIALSQCEQCQRGVFNTGAMGALAPAIFGHSSTVGKNCGR